MALQTGRGLPRVLEHPPVHVPEQWRACHVRAVRCPRPLGLQLPRRALLLLREGQWLWCRRLAAAVVVCALPPGWGVRRGRLAVPVCTTPGGPSLYSGNWPCFVVMSRSYCCCFMEHKGILLTCPTWIGPTFEGLAVRRRGAAFGTLFLDP